MSPSQGDAGENGCAAGVYHDTSSDCSCKHCDRSDHHNDRSPSSSLVYHSLPLKDSEKLMRIVTASAKGFSIGAGLKGGLALFSIVARLRRRKALASLRLGGKKKKVNL